METKHHDQGHKHHDHHHHHHHEHNRILLIIVVGGTPTEVEANVEAPLGSVIPIALKQTGNEGQPPQNWELKDVKGTALDITKEIEDFHFHAGTKLFLSLKAGVGGSCGSSR